MKISPARAAAYDALLRVEHDAAFATDALDARLEGLAQRSDAALATELTLGVLRWQRLLDFLLERFTKRGVESLDAEVRLVLRLGIYQLRFLSRVPASAAVNESVELVKRARKSSAAGLVNAMLRRVARAPQLRTSAEPLVPRDLPPAERLGLALSHPTWLVERWLARYGESATRDLLEADNRPPRLTAAALEEGQTENIRASLLEAGYEAMPGRWLAAALELHRAPHAGAARLRDALRAAHIVIQDEASQMIPLLADVRPGQRVLDLCAPPGGKTARLAHQAEPGTVVAADVHPHRLRQMRELLERLSAKNVKIVALDGTQPLAFSARFDRILVDAPCSGTGTLARNPEIRWRLQPGDLRALAEKQAALARQGLAQLASGGRLVYSTCSLEPEENEQVVASGLAGHPGARVVSGEAALAPHLRPGVAGGSLFDARGYFRTLPSRDGTDGFFATTIELASATPR
jgi:16S rRNA (cytosine967-C5)-methyltransferase